MYFYSIGEVEQIAMMKPKGQTEHEEGLLEYLEDIIGSNSFVPKIEEVRYIEYI
jgi:structural maintenance of chromosome 4